MNSYIFTRGHGRWFLIPDLKDRPEDISMHDPQGRSPYDNLLEHEMWQAAADEAYEAALPILNPEDIGNNIGLPSDFIGSTSIYLWPHTFIEKDQNVILIIPKH